MRSGHDHVQQHITGLGGDVHYVGNGNGARAHSEMNTAYKGLVGHSSGSYGFMAHSANAQNLTTDFVVNSAGAAKTVYSFTISK